MKSLLALLGVALAAPSLAAQVGHDPARSPYRDLRYGQFVSLTVGKVFGAGGQLGIAPHDGQVAMLRHDFLADRPLSISLGGGYARLDRNYAVLDVVTDRLRGPIRHGVWFAEFIPQLNFAGGKTWHNLAPYLNVGLGVAMSEKLPADTSGYKFGTKFYLAPAAGVRIFVSRRLFIRLEARSMFWSVGYPARYRDDPDGPFAPEGPLLTGELKEWTPTPILHAGFGFAFRRPFF
jgi:hypothetical protein